MIYRNDTTNKMFQLYKDNVFLGSLTYEQIEKMQAEIKPVKK